MAKARNEYSEMPNVEVSDSLSGTEALELIKKTKAKLLKEAGGDREKAIDLGIEKALGDESAYSVGW